MKRKDILMILIPSVIFVFIWIVFGVYHSTIDSTISDTMNTQIQPIPPNFDTNTINKLKTREQVNVDLETISAGTVSPTPTPTTTIPIVSPLATPTVQASSSGNASSGAELR